MLRLLLILSMIVSAVAAQADTIKVLFLGNSHTSSNSLTNQVRSLLAKPGRTIQVKAMYGGLLQDIAQNPSVRTEIQRGKYNVVVLQGAGLSQSHQYVYPNDGAIALAKLAKQYGARPLLFAEWSRRGIQETNYILGVYATIARPSRADTIPVCRAFDSALRQHGNLALWSGDGNHSSPLGAYLASCVIATAIDPQAPLNYIHAGVNVNLGKSFKLIARGTPVIPAP